MGKLISEAPLVEIAQGEAFTGNLPNILARHAQEVGPLFRRHIAFEGEELELVYLVGAEANKLVFNTQREVFSHKEGWTPIIGDLMGEGLLNMDNPAHTRARRMWNPAFTSAYMAVYLPLMERVITHHTSTWVARGEVDLYQEAREITFHVAATALAGIHATDEVARLQRLFYELLPRAVPGFRDQDALWDRALAAKDELDAMLLALIAARRALPAEEARGDVLWRLVHARDDEGQPLSDEEVLAHLYILLVAGHETTTTLAAWTLYYLATRDGDRQRIAEELDAAPAPFSMATLRAVPTLDAFIGEVGRLHSPVQIVPRGVLADVEFAGYVVPAGANVRVAVAACHRLPQYFADPQRFDLDRLLPPRDEDRKTPYALVTFGGGPRLCIGINFANLEVKALAAQVLRAFTLTSPVHGAPVDVGFITTTIPSGLPMRVAPRG
ncbi:MAG TPA: cytochrome P450 [Ktedonobacterales bacterium]|nr:cytochrome P450 [Ktedonobacterales bacterium]